MVAASVDIARSDRDNRGVPRSRLWLLPLLLAIMIVGAWVFGRQAQTNDRELPVYVTGAERMLAGEEIYRAGLDKKPFTYPPFAAVPFVPFAWLAEEWRAPAWFCVNFVLLLLVVRWLHAFARREAPDRGPPRLVLFWVVTALLGAHHVFSVLSNQSHDLLIAFAVMLTAAAWCRGSSLAGAGAGLGAAIKATPMLFACLFVFRLRAKPMLLLLATVVGLSLLPDWVFPRDDGRSWIVAWYEVNLRGLDVGAAAQGASAWNAHSWLNQSLSGTMTRLLTAPVDQGPFVDPDGAVVAMSANTCKWISRVLQLAVVGVIAFGVRGAARAVRDAADPGAAQRTVGLGEVAAIACGMVLLSPQSSKAHFCVWLFPAAFLADRVLRGRRDVVLWILLALALALGALTGKDLLGKTLGNKLNVYGNVTWCTVLMLIATVRALRTDAAAVRSR